ncbi:hypothetical protein Tco_0316697 [Tanacetum coccineum]
MSLSLAENVIVVGADNRPPMLNKTNYNSWASQPGTETTPAIVRARTYTDLTDEEKLRESVDITAPNIVLKGLELSLQERESKLYDDFDTFTFMLGETIHSYYIRQHEAHANELSSASQQSYPSSAPQCSYDAPIVQQSQYQPQDATYSQVVHQQPYQAPTLQQSYQAPAIYQQMQPYLPELDSRLVVPSFNPSDDPIASLNKAMTFLSTTFASRFPQTNNQLRTSSNPRNQATIQDERVTVQTVQGRQTQGYAFQTDDLDAFDSDYDDVTLAKAVLMANLSSYDSNVLSKVPFHDTNIKNAIKTETPVVQSTSSYAQQDTLLMSVIEEMSSQVAKCNKVQQENIVAKETLSAELKRYKEQVKLLEQIQKFDLNDREKYIDGQLRQIELANKNDMIEKAVYNELLKKCSPLENRCISLEIKLQQNKETFQNNRPPLNLNAPEFKEFFTINDLHAQLEAKNVSIVKLKEHIANIKGKNVVESVQNVHNSNVITSKVHKFDMQNNRNAHIDYLKVTQEHTDTLWDIVEQARALKPLDTALDYACKYTQRIQELLVCVCASRPSTKHVSDKLVVVTPMNMTRKVSNKKQNKVEDHPKIAKSSLNNLNRISKSVCNVNVRQSVLNVNSQLMCATCNECMFDSIYDSCVRDYLVDMNARVKSKFVKPRNAKSKKKKMWKSAGKIYSSIGYRWVPISRNFTIVGNACPLTRITSTKVAPTKKITPPKPSDNPNPKIKIFHRSTKVAIAVRFNDTPSILGTKSSNIKEPNKNWGSTASTYLSSSHVNFRSYKSYFGTWT